MRLVNRLASLLLSLVLLFGGLLLAAEAAAVALGQGSLVIDRRGWFDTLAGTQLRHPAVRGVSLAVFVVGLLILVAQLRVWTPDRLAVPLADGWHLHRRSVERRLAVAADRVPGVTGARARVRRLGHGWRAHIRAAGDTSARPAVEEAVRRELDRLAAPPAERLDVDLVRQGRTS